MDEFRIHTPSPLTTSPRRLREFLAEDIGSGDISSLVIDPDREGRAAIITREPCTLAGLEEAAAIFGCLFIPVRALAADGVDMEAGGRVLEACGNIRAMLAAERTALNLLARMSGIATLTRNLVARAREVNPEIRIACSRKTTPGFRFFEKKAVIMGGGDPHRFRLDDCIILKDNHLGAAGSIREAVLRARAFSFTKKIEVEAATMSQVREAVDAGADIIMLDNMAPEAAGEAARVIRERDPRIVVEISGGITPENILAYAPHADVISLGYLTHSYRSVDLSMELMD